MISNPQTSLREAMRRASEVSAGRDYRIFLELVHEKYPWMTEKVSAAVERDYFRVVDQHLEKLIPHVQRHIDSGVKNVLDFGCGSGGSAIALAMVYPSVACYGTDIDEGAITVARERAKLYGVADRCHFRHVQPGTRLPFSDEFFDFSVCSSVLEYTQADVRRFCVQEMVRLVRTGKSLFFSVPNRLYPFEIHTRRWGWNYFPKLLNATTVDCTYWEIRRLAEPAEVSLHRTPVLQLFRPWSALCLKKERPQPRPVLV